MGLHRKQELFLDAIEYFFQMVQIGYQRLLKDCKDLSDEKITENDTQAIMEYILLDAWTIIDVTKRLRTMLQHMPGLKHSLKLKLFLNRSSALPDLRDYVQHLEDKANDVSDTGRLILGSFSWATEYFNDEKEPQRVKVLGVVPGRLESVKGIPLINPAGREFHSPIDHIELTAAETTLNLSELVRRIEQFSLEFIAARDKAI